MLSQASRKKCSRSLQSMNPQDAAAQLLYKIMGGMIPQPAKQQGMPVEAEH
jgi:hypothetical protein